MRGSVCRILRRAKLLKDSLIKDQQKALSELKSLKQVLILPADRGSVTVVMKKEDHHSVRHSIYSRLKSDPTRTQEARLIHILKGLEKTGELPTPVEAYWVSATWPGFMVCLKCTKMGYLLGLYIVSCI